MVILFKPNAEFIQNLKPGDTIPDTFDNFCEIVRIFAKQQAIDGKWFCYYYAEFGENSTMSDSIRQDTLHRTFELSKHFTSHEIDRIDKQLPSGVFDAMTPERIREKFLS